MLPFIGFIQRHALSNNYNYYLLCATRSVSAPAYEHTRIST